MHRIEQVIDSLELNQIKIAAEHLRALDNPLRLRILEVIWENNNRMAVSQLYRKMELVQSVASAQLAILRKSFFVEIQREGKYVYYSVNRERIDEVLKLSQQMGNV